MKNCSAFINEIFFFFCVRSIFHHFVINIRVHNKFYRKVDESLNRQSDNEIACFYNDRVS
jgi:hypothetical protein